MSVLPKFVINTNLVIVSCSLRIKNCASDNLHITYFHTTKRLDSQLRVYIVFMADLSTKEEFLVISAMISYDNIYILCCF